MPLLSACLAGTLVGGDKELENTLRKVEERYNRAQTLRVHFTQIYAQAGGRRMEAGELSLRKPGRMRWDYASPAGKLFISDGKHVYLYSPAANRVDKMKLKETEDMRAPLAFLLGKLDFSRDFKGFEAKREDGDLVVKALPKSGKLPYTQVTFTVSPSYEIRRLVVLGQDQSVLEFQFAGETLNPPLSDQLFRFTPPKGAEVVESSQD